MKTTAARLHAFGNAADVLRVESIDLPDPAPDEIQVEMIAAPINPADFNIIAGTYGQLPELPAVIGNEGAGRVLAVGSGVTRFQSGDLVAMTALGAWCRHRNLPATAAVPLPPGIDTAQAAMLCVNPPTAAVMIDGFTDLSPGDWIVQNAANSGVGRAVIQIARHRGFKTLNVVRRPELIAELTALGADAVVLEDTDLRSKTPDLCGGKRPRLALNAVGGASALNIANALAPGGTHVTYGAMSRQPLKVPNGLVIFADLRFRGFWLRRWIDETAPDLRERTLTQLAELMRAGTLHVPVAATFPLEELSAALAAAEAEARGGKILLDLSQ